MADKIKKSMVILFLFFLVFIPLGGAENIKKEKVIMNEVTKVLREHYSREALDDNFSKKAYDLFIKNLDYNKRFLLQEDIKKLNEYETRMADDFSLKNTEILDVSKAIMDERIQEIRKYAKELLAEPVDLTSDESLEMNQKKRDFCRTAAEQKELWRKYLKYEVLFQYYDFISVNSNFNSEFQPDIEKKARAKVAKNIDQILDRMQKEKEEDSFDRYLNIIAGCFDPHTSYMPPVDKKDFDIAISGTFEGIGASLKEEGEYIKVVDIIPGSAAWRQNLLKSGDIILKVAQGKDEPVDVVNMPVKDVVKIIRGPKGTEVRLTVRKPDGQMTVIPIIRDKVVLEDTYVRAGIINDEKSGKKYGYIYLPLFYRDFNNKNGRNATDDMRRELKAMQEENVSGVIFDLRNNGGGALEDAINIAGLFIESGPVVQVKDGDGDSKVFNDTDKGIVYSGPLVVMINTFSASASEIVAAALQDYGRGVILGGHTFGKGTVQQIVDLDNLLFFNDFKPLGSVKLTVQKFYRINGDSTQLKGVTGDIPIPDLYDGMDVGEKSLDYPLPWDTTQVQSYPKWNTPYKLDDLRNKSRARIQKSEIFNLIISNSGLLKQQMDHPRPLQLAKFLEEQKNSRLLGEKINRLLDALSLLDIKVPDEVKKEKDYADRKDKIESYIKLLQKDIYVQEAVNVLSDIK